MFRFENPEYLWLLVVVAILALIRFVTYFNQKNRLRKFGDPDLIKQLMPDVSRLRPLVKFCLLELAFLNHGFIFLFRHVSFLASLVA